MRTIRLEDLERQLVARKRQLGIVGIDFLPVNDGARRTASKRRLLTTMAESAASQGREPRFRAKPGVGTSSEF
jgi:hypothetical protein